MDYQKTAEFDAEFKSVKRRGKKFNEKNLGPRPFAHRTNKTKVKNHKRTVIPQLLCINIL
jgi:hypothetical protein